MLLIGLVLYGLLGKLALDPVLISYMADITPSSMYSRVYGFFNFSGMLSSIFAPYITGYFADQTGSLEFGFYLSGVLLIIGGILFIFTDKRIKPTIDSSSTVMIGNVAGEGKIG